MSSSTSRPSSRNASAMRVATKAAFNRTSGGSSEVATTTTVRHALGAQVLLEELADLAPPLTDQSDDAHVGVGAAGDLSEQAGLADAGAREDAQALTLAAGHQGVEGPDTEGERFGHAGTRQGVRRLAGQVDVADPRAQGRTAVHRATQAVEHAAEQGVAHG